MWPLKPKPRKDDTFPCPHCGHPVPAGRPACPECGSDHETGWSEDADLRAADLPTGYAADDEFDYEAYVKREFGPRSKTVLPRPLVIIVIAVALVVLVLALVLALIR